MAPSLAPAMAPLASSQVHITLAPVPVASISPAPVLMSLIDPIDVIHCVSIT